MKVTLPDPNTAKLHSYQRSVRFWMDAWKQTKHVQMSIYANEMMKMYQGFVDEMEFIIEREQQKQKS